VSRVSGIAARSIQHHSKYDLVRVGNARMSIDSCMCEPSLDGDEGQALATFSSSHLCYISGSV
jgi:hypothetical protein